MADVEVRLKLPGINAVLRKAQPLCDQAAREISSNAGDGFEAHSSPHPRTGRAYVDAVTIKARRSEAKNLTLTKAAFNTKL